MGVNTLETYRHLVNEAIDKALAALKNEQAKPYTPSESDIGAWPAQWDDLSN